jgi:branched-chain amino acid transport system permease protein
MMIIIGGLGSIPGSVIGAVIVALLPEILKSLAQWQQVIYGVMLILFMIFLPKGLIYVFKALLIKCVSLIKTVNNRQQVEKRGD